MTVKELEEQAATDTKIAWMTRFQALRRRIAQMVVEQVKDKAIMRLPNNGRGSPELAARVKKFGDIYNSQSVVLFRAVKITAALILHHEMRGSDCQPHHICDRCLRAVMNIGLGMLREEIEKECAST